MGDNILFTHQLDPHWWHCSSAPTGAVAGHIVDMQTMEAGRAMIGIAIANYTHPAMNTGKVFGPANKVGGGH